MADYDTTRPIRSTDVKRQAEENENRFASAETQITEPRRRVEMAGLALRAQRAPRPANVRPGDAHVMNVPVLPGPDAERRGRPVASLTTSSERLLEGEDLQGEGEIELLRAGSVWAAVTANRNDTFEARLQPARLAQYNELLIPHVAGTASLTVYGPEERYSVDAIGRSRLLRFDRPKQFNGHIKIDSQSRAQTDDGGHIHALGGLSFFRSEWSSACEMRASLSVPEGGQLSGVSASFRPSGASPTTRVYQNGTEQSLPLSVSKGDRIQLRFPSVGGRRAPTYARVELSY